jgi:LysM repeat protein
MRFKEIISEEVVKADIDWQQWKAAMAASAIERNVPKGIDAIVYLGIIGDPVNSDLGVRFKRTAQVGMDVSAKGQGYIQPGATAQYSANDFTVYGPKDSSRDQVGRDFDILFDFQGEPLERQNWKKFQDALSNTLAHELMHRGLAIIDRVPAIKSNIPEPSKTYFEQRFSNNIKGLYNADQLDPKRDFFPTSNSPGNAYLEHMMIYAMFTTKEYLDRPNNVEFTAQVQKFRKIYMDIESAANRYVLSYPIPPGSLPALRAELDNKTPDNINVTVKMDNKVPTVELTKSQDTTDVAAKRTVPPGVPVAWIDPDGSNTSKITAPAGSTSDVDNTAAPQGISNDVIKGQKVSTPIPATPPGYKGSAGSQKLQQLNPAIKNVNLIYPGQKIKLPNGNTVTVKLGDTLDKIASRNSINEDRLFRIKQLAGLRS